MDTVRLVDLLIDVQEQLETLSEISSPEDYNQGRSILFKAKNLSNL